VEGYEAGDRTSPQYAALEYSQVNEDRVKERRREWQESGREDEGNSQGEYATFAISRIDVLVRRWEKGWGW